MRRGAYVVRLIFSGYTTRPMRAEMTQAQADALRKLLERRKGEGVIRDYDLGPPTQIEWVHAMIFTAGALRIEIEDLIATEQRLSREDR